MNLLTLKIFKADLVKKQYVAYFLCVWSSSMFAQRSVELAILIPNIFLENVTEYADANTQLDSKIRKWKSEIEARLTELEDQKKQLNNERILLDERTHF